MLTVYKLMKLCQLGLSLHFNLLCISFHVKSSDILITSSSTAEHHFIYNFLLADTISLFFDQPTPSNLDPHTNILKKYLPLSCNM